MSGSIYPCHNCGKQEYVDRINDNGLCKRCANTNTAPVRFIPYWEEAALCAQTDPTLFFGAENEQAKDKRKRISLAKSICANCPVILNCLQQAVDTNDMHAIMGGTTPEERGHSGNWTGKRITSWSIQTILRNRTKEATHV